MTGYYAVDFKRTSGDWLTISYWEMEETLLSDFLLHILDVHHMTPCPNDIRVRRVNYAGVLEARTADPDQQLKTYHGLHIQTHDE